MRSERRVGKARWGRWRRPAAAERSSERGQVLPIFAVMVVVLLGGAAMLTDVSWWWVNEQGMQRAADAGALAGAIYLPGDRATAYAKAYEEAAKNGYVDGEDGVVVTPSVDPGDPRQLNVDIAAPVSTYFAKVFSIDSIDAAVVGSATYVLPVPMGSPQRYYGVGFFQSKTPAGSASSQPAAPSATLGGTWTRPERAFVADESPTVLYATARPADASREDYGNFGIDLPAGATVAGIEVRLEAWGSDPTGCQVRVYLGDGSSWTSRKTVEVGTSPPETTTPATLGGASDTWGRSWSVAQVEGPLRVRVESYDPGWACSGSSTISLDALDVVVYYTTPETLQEDTVFDPVSGAPLASQGFWGAIFTPGGIRENGDRYGPKWIGGNNPPDGANGGPNPDYDPEGYQYLIEVGGGGQVQLFDPIFCATGRNATGGWLGTGDHWTNDHDDGGGENRGPISVRYMLYNTNGTPYTTSDDYQVGSTWSHDPGGSTLGDFSGAYGTPQNASDANRQDCSAHPAHNHWILPSGWSGLPAGTYRLNVNTNLGLNDNLGAENLFSIWVGGSGTARVYGAGRMAAYTNLDDSGGGRQEFYFAQIDPIHAGKTMEITLFDPGEASSPSYLRFLSPEGGTYHYATFDWYSNDGRSGSNTTSIQTSDGSSFFNNRIVTIDVVLPDDYGTGSLDPDGLGEDGWWKVEYDVRAGNDTTTWEVQLVGNPVHLVLE